MSFLVTKHDLNLPRHRSQNTLLTPPWEILYSLTFLCRYEYHWADGTNIKKPIKCSAPKYIDYLMTWVQDQLDDETLFPSKIGELNKVIYFRL